MKFPFSFYKAGPTDYVVKYVSGARRAAGKGAWFLVGPRTTLVRIPTTDLVTPFAFTELTADSQQVVVQGELVIRLDVERILERRDYSIDPAGGDYLTEDPEKVSEEAAHTLQAYVRSAVREKTLSQALVIAAELERSIVETVRAKPETFGAIGVTVANLFITAVSPANPDLKKALEAEARERMLAAADKALADRRMNAAQNDRSLKEYEAETARTLEDKRSQLVEVRNRNVLAEATADAEATAKRLNPYRDLDPATLLALGVKEIAASGRVGQFTITPDLLAAVQSASRRGEPQPPKE